jgi:hypothetical protein
MVMGVTLGIIARWVMLLFHHAHTGRFFSFHHYAAYHFIAVTFLKDSSLNVSLPLLFKVSLPISAHGKGGGGL